MYFGYIIGMELNNIAMVGLMDQLTSHNVQSRLVIATLMTSTSQGNEEHCGGMLIFFG